MSWFRRLFGPTAPEVPHVWNERTHFFRQPYISDGVWFGDYKIYHMCRNNHIFDSKAPCCVTCGSILDSKVVARKIWEWDDRVGFDSLIGWEEGEDQQAANV